MQHRLARLDLPMLGATAALVGLGTLAVASSTMDGPGTEGLWRMQMIWLLIAGIGAAVVITVDYRLWAGTALALQGVVILLLVVVLFFGREVGGNRSWLDFGAVRVQPSELAKWTTCLTLAFYLARRVRDPEAVRRRT